MRIHFIAGGWFRHTDGTEKDMAEGFTWCTARLPERGTKTRSLTTCGNCRRAVKGWEPIPPKESTAQ